MRGWQCDDPEQCEHQEEGEADRAAFAIADDVLGVSDLQELGRICLDLLAMAVALSAACVRLWSLFAREERSRGDVHATTNWPNLQAAVSFPKLAGVRGHFKKLIAYYSSPRNALASVWAPAQTSDDRRASSPSPSLHARPPCPAETTYAPYRNHLTIYYYFSPYFRACTQMFMMVAGSDSADTPIYEAEFINSQRREDNSHLNQFIIHAALDMVDDSVWGTQSMLFKAVDKFNDYIISSFVTAGHVKLMLLHDVRNEDGIRNFFHDVHELYVKVLLNPFYTKDQPITSPLFDSRVKLLGRKYF